MTNERRRSPARRGRSRWRWMGLGLLAPPLLALPLILVGCDSDEPYDDDYTPTLPQVDEEPGPAERAGETLDEGAARARETIEEKAGELRENLGRELEELGDEMQGPDYHEPEPVTPPPVEPPAPPPPPK